MPVTPPPPIQNKFFAPRAFNAIDHTPNRYHNLYMYRPSNSDSDAESESLPSDFGDSSDIEDYLIVKQPDPSVPPSHDITLASYNLQSYLLCVVLPRMHFDREKAVEAYKPGEPPLSLEGRSDGITTLGKIKKNQFQDCIRLYNAYGIYPPKDFPLFRTGIGRPLDPVKEALSLDAEVNKVAIPGECAMPELPPPVSLEDVTTWVVNGPLKTVQRALHLSNFSSRRWWFEKASSLGENRDRHAIFLWRFHPETMEESNRELETLNFDTISKDQVCKLNWESASPPKLGFPEQSLAVIIEPPWVTTLSQLQRIHWPPPPVFRVPHSAGPQSGRYGGYDDLEINVSAWCHAVDACKQLKTEYFAITTYEGWIFGKFGDEKNLSSIATPAEGSSRLFSNTKEWIPKEVSWTTCQITKVLKYSTLQPSVIQALTYWIARSMRLDYTDVLPLTSSVIRPERPIQPFPSLCQQIERRPPPVIEISKPDGINTTRAYPQLPSGLPIPITQEEETKVRQNPRYLEDLKTLGLASFVPEVVLAEFQARVEEYFASDHKTRNVCLDTRPPTRI